MSQVTMQLILCHHSVRQRIDNMSYGNMVIWGETIVEFFCRVLLGVSKGSTLLQMATTWDSESTGTMNYLCNKCNNITKHLFRSVSMKL